jgi:hypothetical protein
MVSATPSTPVPGGSISRTEDMGVEGLRPLCCVAKSDRRDDRSPLAMGLQRLDGRLCFVTIPACIHMVG